MARFLRCCIDVIVVVVVFIVIDIDGKVNDTFNKFIISDNIMHMHKTSDLNMYKYGCTLAIHTNDNHFYFDPLMHAFDIESD